VVDYADDRISPQLSGTVDAILYHPYSLEITCSYIFSL
jgi:hypothetical protein